MAYEGGYTSAVNSQSQRESEEMRRAYLLESIRQQKIAFDEQQAQQNRRREARQALGSIGDELAALFGDAPTTGPQPPPPGQPSVPMIPPPGQIPPPGAARPGMPPGMPMGQLPPPPGPGFATPPAPAGAPTAGLQATAPGARPAGPLPGPQGAPAMPPPWRPLPGTAPPAGGPAAAAGGQIPPPPSPAEPDAVMPKKMVGVSDMLKLLKIKGIEGEKALDMLDEWKPYMDRENKMQLDALRTEAQARNAALAAYAHVINAQASAKRAETGATKLTTVDQPKAKAYVAKMGGGKPGVPGIVTPDAKQAHEDAMDLYAWKYIVSGNLPYRKGTGGGKDKNDEVMGRVATLARGMGMSPEEIVAQPADWKANAQSLAFQTKKLDAIEGTLESFHNNLDTWDNIAKGLAPKLGGERVKEAANLFEKINFVGVKDFDEIKLKIQQQFNDPTVSAYLVAAMAAAMDYARIMQGPQSIASLTEGARKDAERLISAGFNDDARKGVLAALESDTQGQVKGVKDQLDKIRGRMGMKGGRTAATAASAGKPPAGIPEGSKPVGFSPDNKRVWKDSSGKQWVED